MFTALQDVVWAAKQQQTVFTNLTTPFIDAIREHGPAYYAFASWKRTCQTYMDMYGRREQVLWIAALQLLLGGKVNVRRNG